MKGYRNLKVWSESHDLTLSIYRITRRFPDEEKYGITSQIRRAAFSVPSNIVEGKSRGSQKELKYFLTISRGSVEEVSYFLLLSKDLKYISNDDYELLADKCSHISAMLNNLIRKIVNDI